MKIKNLFFTVFLAATIFCFGSVVLANNDNSNNNASLSERISALIQQITQLQAKLKELQSQQGSIGTEWCHTFNANIGMGQKTGNPEVEALKRVLQKEGVYSPSTANTEEGGYTESLASAVTGLQEKYASEILTPYNLRHGTGFVGKSTRAWVNAHYGCEKRACTMEAKLCPDGSYVGRTGPNCEFSKCPTTDKCKTDTDCPQIICAAITGITTPCPTNKCVEERCISSNLNKPSITVTSPNGGETWKVGETHTLTWTSNGLGNSTVDLYVISSDGTVQNNIAMGTVNTGTYTWTIPQNQLEGAHRFYVSSGQISDHSNNVFSIWKTTQPSITVTSPNGGETWKVGETHNITWNSAGLPSNAILSIGINGDGQTSTMAGGQIATNVSASNGNYSWTIPAFLGENLAGKKYNAYATCINCSTQIGDTSDNNFTITQ